MTSNQVVFAMFNVKKYIRMVRIVSFGDWNEDPEWLFYITIFSYPQVAVEDHLKS